MRRLRVLLCVPLLFAAACAGEAADSIGDQAGAPKSAASAGDFAARAAAVAEVWRRAPGRDAWRSGFVPLQELTVPPTGALREEAKMALAAGWFQLKTGM